MKRIVLGRRGRLTASVASVALVVGAAAGTGLAVAANARQVDVVSDFGPGDGLSRYVVQLERSAVVLPAVELASATTPLSAAAPARVPVDVPADVRAQLGDGGAVVHVGGTDYYATDRGARALGPGASDRVLPLDQLRQWAAQLGEPLDLPFATAPVQAAPSAAPSSSPAAAASDAPAEQAVVGTADDVVTDAQLAALEAAGGVTSAQRLRGGLVLVAGDLTLDQARRLPGVTSAERSPEVAFQSQAISDPAQDSYGWHLENNGRNAYGGGARAGVDVAAPAGWAASDGQGVVVADIDSGFDTDHPDLVGSQWVNPACGSDADGDRITGDCGGWNFYTNSADVDNGANGDHGVMTAGVIGARLGNGTGVAGVAPRATIMPLVVGGGSSVQIPLAVQAIRYAVDHGADVINASWGGAVSGYWLTQLSDAVAYAEAHGVLVVAAAGNDAADRDTTPMYPASLTSDDVISVGSSTASDAVSSFSAFGAASVDLFAPGSSIYTTYPDGGYRITNGTSFSAPATAAAVALYLGAHPTWTAPQVKAGLLADAERVPVYSGRSVTGGRLDLTNLGATAGGARYTFSSMSGAAGTVTPSVAVDSDTGAGAYQLRLTLAMRHEGDAWAVADVPVAVGGQSLTTDDDGQVVVDLPAVTGSGPFTTQTVSPALVLGPGTYALVAQLVKDGTAVGRPFAAPLVVGAVGSSPTASPTATGGAPTSGATTGAPGSGPTGTAAPTSTAPGGGGGSGGTASPTATSSVTPSRSATPLPTGGGQPGIASPSASATGTATATGAPGGGAPSAPRPTSAPGTSSTPRASSTPGTSATGAPSSSATGTSTPTSTPRSTATGSPSGTPSASSSGTPSATQTPGGSTQYPAVGDFRVTAMSPTRVPNSGGTTVTVTGEGFSFATRVRVGAATADVLAASGTQLVFRTPARAAGAYDVVLSTTAKTSTLTAGLTYYATAPGSTPAPSSSSSSSTGSGGSGGGSTSSPTPTASSAPTATPTTAPTASPAPTARTGPNGERLRRTALASSLGAVWGTSCATTCGGTRV